MEKRYWKEAVEKSKIPRLRWKKILGKSLNKYVYDAVKSGMPQEEIIYRILKQVRKTENQEYITGWSFQKIVENVKIGVSARCSEVKIFKK
ncbi:MAG: hypothetical protein ACOC5T_01640 [Elusimicrobiota bacterium]